MNFREEALVFDCEGDSLVGILSVPHQSRPRGVLIVVGGPQYRAGSHRQFTLLARYLAGRGIPAMRFDYRGMGDSEGVTRSFEQIDADIKSALDVFFTRIPALREVVIWGLCDAASAALFYAHKDPRVSGLVLLNPWVRTGEGQAQAYLKHYYLARFADARLWRKIRAGEFDFLAAIKSLLRAVKAALGGKKVVAQGARVSFPERMAQGWAAFRGEILLILSGNDLTAQEFRDMVARSASWRNLTEAANVERRDLAQATHTFSRREWRDRVAEWTCDWIVSRENPE